MLSRPNSTCGIPQTSRCANYAQLLKTLCISREGQLHVQKGRKGRPRTGSNSLRTDIPKNDLPEEIRRKDGDDYFDADDDNNADRQPADKLFNEILGKTNK